MPAFPGPVLPGKSPARLPTAVAAAGSDPEAARCAQELFSRPYFRVYTNPDLMGVELGGAIKNVMAIAAGASDGLGFGHSSRAALITRGLAEMTRLGVNLGAQAETFSGLAGLGDLVLTCTGDLSRNRQRRAGAGQGKKSSEILGGMRMVAEGVRTTKALWELARRQRWRCPSRRRCMKSFTREKNPAKAVEELMSRESRSERDNIPDFLKS